MVVVDMLTKYSHFILVKLMHKVTTIAEIYMQEISRLHGVPKTIVSNRDSKFTKLLERDIQRIEINSNFSTTYHPKRYGQT
jgi:hypothetical protein